MKHRIVLSVITMALMAGTASFAQTSGIPDMENSWAGMTCGGLECTPVLFNLPNGGGSPMNDAAWIFVGGTVDATITLYLRDSDNVPIVNYPREDIWIWGHGPMWDSCPSGTIADANTDVNGETIWVNPLRAGGWSEGPTVVMVSGSPLLSGDLNLAHNSPDINGDLVVNLTDVAMFASDYYTGYSFISDFAHDGVLNLADVAKFAQSIGAACP